MISLFQVKALVLRFNHEFLIFLHKSWHLLLSDKLINYYTNKDKSETFEVVKSLRLVSNFPILKRG
jgi:hypothetical protein